jgi:hypothetical protein
MSTIHNLETVAYIHSIYIHFKVKSRDRGKRHKDYKSSRQRGKDSRERYRRRDREEQTQEKRQERRD